jgi:oxygen-independent coproporphyrinogen-3 oxidase
LLDHILITFDAFDARISIELDPRSLTSDWMAVIGRVGITQASLGVQTFSPEIQARIGRVQPLADIERAVAGLRDNGIESLNFDLMYGLPGQTCADLAETLGQAVALNPDRIALFGYAHLPAAIKRQRRIDASNLPNAQARFEMARRGFELLTDAGYAPIGFDHFARPDDSLAVAARDYRLHRNFQGFTDDSSQALLGFGASAISRFPDRLVQNRKHVGQYRQAVSDGRFVGERGCLLSPDDRARRGIIEGILCNGKGGFHASLLSSESLLLFDTLISIGLIDIKEREISVTEAGRPYARLIASQFDTYRNGEDTKFSMAV